MSKAVVMLDGADFKALDKKSDGNTYGRIEFTSIDSRRNWSLVLSGEAFNEGDRHQGNLKTSLGLTRGNLTRFLPEEVAKVKDVGCAYVPGSVGSNVGGVDDSVNNLPNIDFFEKYAKGEENVVDTDYQVFLDKVVGAFETKLENAKMLADENDVVFMTFGFPDLLSHKHLYGATDDLIERLDNELDSVFDEHLFISDHTCDVYRYDRTVPAKHQLPAEIYCTEHIEEGTVNLSEDEIYSFLKEWCL